MGVIAGGVTETLNTDLTTQTDDGIHYLHTGQRVFQVVFDSAINCSTIAAKAAAGVPRPMDAYPGASGVFCINAHARRVSPLTCEVTASYSSIQYSLADIDQSPLNAPPQIRFTTITTEESFDIDAYGNPMQLVTGEPFEPSIRVPVEDDVIEITRNMLTYDPVLWSSYSRSTNSDIFFGLPPGTIHLNARDAVTQFAPNVGEYFTVSAKFVIRRAAPGSTDARAWWRRILAQGYYCVIPKEVFNSPKDLLVRCPDDMGQPAAKPRLHRIGCPWPYNQMTATRGTPVALVSGTPFQDASKAEWYEYPIFYPKPYSALQIL